MMKFNIRNGAIGAGLLACSLALANVSSSDKGPVSIAIRNDHQAKVTLSSKDANRLFVLEDKVTSLASNGRLIIRKDKSGGVLLNVKGKTPFTAYLATEKGREFSLYITPSTGSGETVKLIPKTPAAPHYDKHNPNATRFEQSTPYRKAVIKLLRESMLGKEVPGYTFIPESSFDSLPEAQVSNKVKGYNRLKQRVVKLYVGDEMAIRVLRVDNKSGHLVNLKESDFFVPGVRAVALEYRDLGKDEYVFIYEVINND